MHFPLTNPLLPPPDSSKYWEYIVVVKRILNIVLELNTPFPVDETHDPQIIVALTNALNRFNSIYSAKYKQEVADYGYTNQETFVALGKELKEKNEPEFNKLIKDLNDSQWTLLLTGKIHEVQAIGKKIDAALTELFTKGGIVEGAKQVVTSMNRVGLGLIDNHFYLLDGQLHTIHIYNSAAADQSTEVYIPKEFSQIEYVGGSECSTLCINPITQQIIRASHILVLPEIQFQVSKSGEVKKAAVETPQSKLKIQNQIKENVKTANAKGSRFIGLTGGPGGGESPKYVHSHLTIYKDKRSMQIVLAKKYATSAIGEDYNSRWKVYLGDFRNLVKIG